MISEHTGFVSGNDGTLLSTRNGGATWESVVLPTKQSLFGMSSLDKDTGWIVGYNGVVIRTFDGGRSWVAQVTPTRADLFAVAINKNRGFAIGRDGVLLKYWEKR